MKRIKAFCLLVSILNILNSKSQDLKIGDVIPDIEVKNLYNYADPTLKLSDFSKHIIILDFWSTNCTGCLHAFPKMDSLQKVFGDKLQVILINRSSKDSTENFFRLRRKIYKPNLPFITGDSIFQKMFPHKGEPFYVVIDSSKKVMSLPDAITFGNVKKYLANEKVSIVERKKQIYLQSPINEQLLKSILYSSMLLKTTNGIQLTTFHSERIKEIAETFASITKLYLMAYDTSRRFSNGYIRPGRLDLKVSNPLLYIEPTDPELKDDWFKDNSYTYQLLIPNTNGQDKYLLMRKDLDRFFGLKVKIEKRKVKCLTLVRTTTEDRIRAGDGKAIDKFTPTFIMSDKIDSLREFTNQTYSSFSERMRYIVEYFLKMPFFDGTGYNKQNLVSIKMSGETMDSFEVNAYRSELRNYGLDLVEKFQIIDVLVLQEKKRE